MTSANRASYRYGKFRSVGFFSGWGEEVDESTEVKHAMSREVFVA
jgi:hypothetical protein